MNPLVTERALKLGWVVEISEVNANAIQKHEDGGNDSTDPPEHIKVLLVFSARLFSPVPLERFKWVLIRVIEDVRLKLVHTEHSPPLLSFNLFRFNLTVELLAVKLREHVKGHSNVAH